MSKGITPLGYKKNNANTNEGGRNSSGGGRGGGDGGPKITDEERKAQSNLGGISGFNFQTPQLSAQLADKALDIGDQGNSNISNYAIKNARRKSAEEWYKGQQDLQSVASQLSDASGNLANGSGFYDFLDLLARRDDQQDVEVLNSAHNNESSIWKDYYEAAQQNVNARNQAYIDAQEAMRGVSADYVAQSNNINPELASGMVDAGGHSLKLPDWLKSDGFAEGKFKPAVNPTMQGFFRPEMDAARITKNNTVDREPTTENASSTNRSYWDRMRSGYRRRNE